MGRNHIEEGGPWGRRRDTETFISEGKYAAVTVGESGSEKEAVRQTLDNADTYLTNMFFGQKKKRDGGRADSTQGRHGAATRIGCTEGATIRLTGASCKPISSPVMNRKPKRRGDVATASSTGVEKGVDRQRRVRIGRVPREGADPNLMGEVNSGNRGIRGFKRGWGRTGGGHRRTKAPLLYK